MILAILSIAHAQDTDTVVDTDEAGQETVVESAETTDAAPASAQDTKGSSSNTNWPYLSEVQDWWLAHGEAVVEGDGGLRERAVALGLPANTTFLIHAPTGQLLAPAPSAIREADPVQVVLITPSWVVSDFAMDPESCAKPSRFDLDDDSALALSLSTDTGMTSMSTGRREDYAEADRYRASLVGQHLSCGAGTLSYSLQVAHPAAEGPVTTTSSVELAVRNTAHLAAIVVPGWDFGARSEAWIDPGAATSTDDGISDQGSVVLDDGVTIGPGLYAGAQWMIGGVDYADLRWYNHFANPFFAIGISGLTPQDSGDTVRVTSPSYLVGTAITPTGGISLAVGASVRPALRLRGLADGDLIQDGAAVSYTSTWDGVQPSLFVGLAIDSQIYNALSDRIGLSE